jgi:hypothetical protein
MMERTAGRMEAPFSWLNHPAGELHCIPKESRLTRQSHHTYMNTTFIFASIIFLIIATGYLLVKTGTQFLLYFLVIFLSVAHMMGVIWKIMHLPGADELLMLGIAANICGAVLLIFKSIKNKSNSIHTNKLILGMLIISQFMIPIFLSEHNKVGLLLNYPVTALAGTILINQQSEHKGEKNLLILILLHGVVFIVGALLKVF